MELRLPFEEHRLGNGLRTIFVSDDSSPVVAVDLWYHVGSKDESPDRTGLAHLFEHLMFEGSQGYDDDYFRALQEAGGAVNGSTNRDRTNYYEVVPPEFLERALWLEADRMGRLLPTLSKAKLENQRSIVKNERRQRVDNQPYGRIGEVTSQLLHPARHPYSWPVIGWMEHLDEIVLDDARQFFRRHYHPRNATLVVAGSFDRLKAEGWIEQYFGWIPSGEPTPLPYIPDGADWAPQRTVVEDAVALSRVDLSWPAPRRFDPEEPALDFVAEILGGSSRNSRLKRRLLHDDPIAATVNASNATYRLCGHFAIRSHCLAGGDPARVEAAILEEVEKLCREPPTEAEMQRVRNTLRTSELGRVESIHGRTLALQHFLYFNGEAHPDSLIDELKKYDDVAAEQVSAAARKHLSSPPVVVATIPGGRKGVSAVPAQQVDAPFQREPASTDVLPRPGSPRLFTLKPVERTQLRNGLNVWCLRHSSLPRVECQLLVDAGALHETLHDLGVARLTADVMDQGTTSRDGPAIADVLDRLGASISLSSGVEAAYYGMRSLDEGFDEAFRLFAEVVRSPRFAKEDFERERDRLRADLVHRARKPSSIAEDALAAAMFGSEHPYGRHEDGTLETISKLDEAALKDFHRRRVQPGGAHLLIVGCREMADVLPLVECVFGDWSGTGAQAAAPPVEGSTAEVLEAIDFAGATQSVVRVGRVGPPRASDDHLPLTLWNGALGGHFISRLNSNLRERLGLTYGARSTLSGRRAAGSLTIDTDVDSASVADAVREVLREARELAGERPLERAEFDAIKAFHRRRFTSRFETASSVMAHLAQLAVYRLPEDHYTTYLDRLDAITREDSQAAGSRHFSGGGWKAVVVGPADSNEKLRRVDPTK